MTSDDTHVSHIPVGHLYGFLEKCLFSFFAHFFNWAEFFVDIDCMSSLYVLDINSLSDI